LGVALTFGLIVLAMIYTLGDISGAHINPAVTIGFWAARRFQSRQVLPYLVSQCAGAFLASIVLRLLSQLMPGLERRFPQVRYFKRSFSN
jgi:glycerol uptake facilitator-like aquaporin